MDYLEGKMKYHRWRTSKLDNSRVECVRCLVSMPKNARPRRKVHCPPTAYELSIGGAINRGRVSRINYHKLKFPLSAVRIVEASEGN